MNTELDLKIFIDFKSPYSYLALDDLFSLPRDFNIHTLFFPWSYNPEPNYRNIENRTDIQYFRARYLYKDTRRIAKKKGLTIIPPERYYDTTLACQGGLYCQTENRFEDYCRIVFEKFWKRDLEIEKLDSIVSIIEKLDLVKSDFMKFLESEADIAYNNVLQEVNQNKIFGIPSIAVNGDLFWGNDRIPLLKETLTNLGLKK